MLLFYTFYFTNIPTTRRSKIPVARKLKEELEEQAVMIKEEAEKQKTESTNLFSAADKLKVPSVDTDTKDQHATEINAQIAEQVPEVSVCL